MIRAAGLVLAVLLLGGCGVRPTGVVYAGDAPTATATASSQAQVFFLSQEMLVPVPRAVGPGGAQKVFDALLAGPTVEERKKGLSTALIGVHRIVVHELDGATLLVETVPTAAKLPPIAFEQIYCTGRALPDQRFMKIIYVNGGGVPYPAVACGGGRNTPVPLVGKDGGKG
jgi:hypothetical protein